MILYTFTKFGQNPITGLQVSMVTIFPNMTSNLLTPKSNQFIFTSLYIVRKTMFSPHLVPHPQRHVTFLSGSQGLVGVGTWCVGRQRAAGAIVGSRCGSKIASGKIYGALRIACVNAIFKWFLKDSRQHSRTDR